MRARIRADFNGLFGDLLCLSHSDDVVDERGLTVSLRSGMLVTVFDEDVDERGERDDLVAHGAVEPSPDWLQCNGSRWVLRIDKRGITHDSDAAPFRVGELVCGVVHLKKEYGFFVRLPEDHFGLVLLPDFADALPVAPTSLPAVGEDVRCVVLAITRTPKGPKVALSMKPSVIARTLLNA